MFNPMSLDGKNVVITGASSGIGKETAIYFSRLGARITLVARNTERLEAVAALLEGDGHHIAPFDLLDCDAIPTWLKTLAKTHGPYHGLVHSAGIYFALPVRAASVEKFDSLMRINLTSAFALAKGMRQKRVSEKGCSLVFLSSVMGLVGQKGLSAYCSSKGGLISLAQSLALELAQEGLRVNCIAPGQVATEMVERLEEQIPEEQFREIEALHPLGMGKPQDVAAAAAFLVADTGRWITGSCLVVDGGYTAQ